MAEYGLRVLITRDGNVLSDVQVQGTSVLIGSGGHCDVRLGPDLLALEHVRLRIEEGQVWAETLSRSPAVMMGGAPFSSGFVTPHDALAVGPLFIQMAAWHEQVKKKSGHKRFIPLVLLLAVLASFAVSAAVAKKGAKQAKLPEPPTSPFIDAEGKAHFSCPEQASASAGVAAADLWREAMDHRERSPFSPRNGLEAVRLMNTAAACYDVGDNRDAGEEARTQATQLRSQLEKSFHVHRVRLDHSIATKDFSLSKVEVAILKSFMAGQDHPYAVWLDNMERWLEVTQGKRQSS
jgi:hypothetical protein